MNRIAFVLIVGVRITSHRAHGVTTCSCIAVVASGMYVDRLLYIELQTL